MYRLPVQHIYSLIWQHGYLFRPTTKPSSGCLIRTSICYIYVRRSQRPLDLRRGSAAALLLGLRARIPPEHGCWPVVIVVCCQEEVSASGWSLIQRSPALCGVSECALESSSRSRQDLLGLSIHEEKNIDIWAECYQVQQQPCTPVSR